MRQIGFVFLALCFCMVSVFADVSLTASFSADKVSVSDRLSYSVEVSGSDLGRVGLPDLPAFEPWFSVLMTSTQQSIRVVNGVQSMSKTHRYVLQALKPGFITLAPARLMVNGQQIQSQAVSVDVVSSNRTASTALTTQPSDQAQQRAPRLFLSAEVDKTSVYLGEPLLFALRLYRQMPLLQGVDFELGNLDAFWVESLPPQKEQVVTLASNRYYMNELDRKMLLPLSTGNIVIEPSRMAVALSLFSGVRSFESNGVTLNVRPLPELGQPADFSGLVGVVTLNVITRPEQWMVGQPQLLQLQLRGTGHLKSVSTLSVDDHDGQFKVYASKVVDEVDEASGQVMARTYDYLLQARHGGQVTLPTFSLSYFSPVSGNYQRVFLELGSAVVSGGNETDFNVESVSGNEIVLDDVLPLRADRLLTDDFRENGVDQRFFRWFFWINGIAFLLFTGVYYFKGYALSRPDVLRRNAYRQVLSVLKNDASDLTVYRRQFCLFLEVIFSHPLQSLSDAELLAFLDGKLPEALYPKIGAVLGKISEMQYAQRDGNVTVRSDVISVIEEIYDVFS